MRLEDQISTPQQSITLYELGIRNESAVFWWDTRLATTLWRLPDETVPYANSNHIAQHTCAEMEVMLPTLADRQQTGGYVQVFEDQDAAYNRYWLAQWMATHKHRMYRLQGPTSAYVRAELLIYLLTAGIQTAADINQRYAKFCELAAKRAAHLP